MEYTIYNIKNQGINPGKDKDNGAMDDKLYFQALKSVLDADYQPAFYRHKANPKIVRLALEGLKNRIIQ